ncbi:hypothetical protein [Rhizobium sp. Leaf384]|uniref:hypothetical protein n=1 Tax=Rhizobium sp. Leaf384 TaxID=1736358 RepID=UPI0012E83AEA|nr:hypothetical protein [Rhizobium sp. Leaf384]
MAAFASVAFFNHPVDSVSRDEVLIRNPNKLQIAFCGLCPQCGLRQAATEEQFCGFGKWHWLIIADVGVIHREPPIIVSPHAEQLTSNRMKEQTQPEIVGAGTRGNANQHLSSPRDVTTWRRL